jgi:hypothetical protein
VTLTRLLVALVALALCVSLPVPAGAAPGDPGPAAPAKKKSKKKKKKKKKQLGDDGDALPAAWETKPAKKKKKKKRKKGKAKAAAAAPQLWKLGASPSHKDVFVQLNFSSEEVRTGVSCAELDSLVNAFATAPVTNPDGKGGISLHIDAGKVCPSRSYSLGFSPVFAIPGNPPCPNLGEMMNFGTTSDYFRDDRIGSFRVGLVGDGCGNTHGAAAQPGTTSTVFTNQNGDFPHVFMHELGHNLGLGHEFMDANGMQPNRLSVMNTQLQLGDSANGPFTQIPDFQRFPIPALNENSMLETTGLQTAAAHRFLVFWRCPPGSPRGGAGGSITTSWPADANVDWNCSTTVPFLPGTEDIQNTPVPADVNGDGDMTDVYPAITEEWSTLDYSAGGRIGRLP